MAAAVVATLAVAQDAETPRDLGLKESTSARLAQVDVTVSGPPEVIRTLTAADFELRVSGKVQSIIVDALCAEPGAPPPSAEESGLVAEAAAPRAATVTYVLFFDMGHLTMMGRHVAIGSARAMLPKLLAGGHRATIVTSAKDLRTVVPLTPDLATLDAALDAMVNDTKDFDTYAIEEDLRIDELLRQLELDAFQAEKLAERFAREERQRQERDLTRLRIALGKIAELDAPKAVLYFADTMRQNPGAHFALALPAMPTQVALEADTGALVLDRVINEAAAAGIRLYTIEGQGMVGEAGTSTRGRPRNPRFATQRVKDAESTLVGLAAETGGRAFLHGGGTPARMAGQIVADLSCVYLLSFDPKGLAEDTPLAVEVDVLRKGVKATTRGRFVVASRSSRLVTRLLTAYVGENAAAPAEGAMRVGIVPIGYGKKGFRGRVQVALPSSRIPGTTFDIGASLVAAGSVAEAGSGRITIPDGSVPAVWEQDMTFPQGAFELVAVSHDITKDDIVSHTLRGSWPKLSAQPVSFGPIAVTQQARAGFLRNGASATSGAIIVEERDPLEASAPIAVVSLVCRDKDQTKPITVARTLVGEAEIPVGKTELAMGADERCAQILDLIPPKTLGPGAYRYVIAASSDGKELARAERKMLVPE